MSEPKRLHPIAAVTNFLKQLKELLFPFLAFLVFGSNASDGNNWFLLGSVAVVVLVLISGIMRWLRFTYRLEEGELRIESGVLIRKKRYIPFERIQSLDMSEGILQRPFGLVKVKIETAGSSGMSDAEAVLTAISKEEATKISDIIALTKAGKSNGIELEETAIPEITEEIIYKISLKELFLLASTSGGVGVVLSAVGAFLTQFDELIPYKKVYNEVEHVVTSGFVFVSILVLLGFLLAWILALVGTMVKYAGFTVKKTDKDLIISRGLLEKKTITIPINRIQAVRVSENLVRQPLGLCSVSVVSAGGSVQNAESSKVLLLPIVSKRLMADILKKHLPQYELNTVIQSVPKRALMRYLIRGWLLTVPITVACIAFFKLWGLLSLIVLALGTLWSYIEYRDAGWSLTGRQLTLRYRGIVRQTQYMRKNKIQTVSMSSSSFQERKELATISGLVKSGAGGDGGKVVDIEKEDALRIYQWYSYTK